MTTKAEITKEFNRLKAFGFKVITFNDNRPLRSQQKGFVDHLLVSRKYLIFVEVKINHDILSEIQKEIGDILSTCSINKKGMEVKYIKTLADARRLVDLLLRGEL